MLSALGVAHTSIQSNLLEALRTGIGAKLTE
jgi:hypothetical protein